jgi:tetratricopeptide (TPR) repeat protein
VKPEAMLGYLKRGETYQRRGDFEAALRDLRRASDIDPTATRPLEERGDADLSLKRYGPAADRYREYVRIDDRAPRVLYKLAYARYNDGHPAEAIDPLQRALSLDDHLAEAYYLLGLCERATRRTDAARAALERALALQPTLLLAREELADLYGSLGKTESRLSQLEALAALDPGPKRLIALGAAYAESGERERAVLTLGRAAERYPGTPYSYVALGRVWLEIAQARDDRVALSKALGALGSAAASDGSSEALTLLGRALLLARDPVSAERTLQDATDKQPVDPAAYFYLADAAERLRHFAIARDALRDYAVLHGDEQDPRRRAAQALRLADLSLRAQDPAAAATYFLAAADDSDGAPDVLVRAAQAQWRAGDRDGARATLARALQRDPGNAAALALKKRL